MPTIPPLPQALQEILEPLCRQRGWRVYIFGSWARGEMHPRDIDIAIQADPPPSEAEMAELRWQLEEAPIPYRIDLVRYDLADPGLRAEIDAHGILWTPENGLK
ncbi:MAG: nucleotidyltransferase domain-containing protein [Bacteroidia bacterium]|nr:nucleotidyltransferase domain-containing protein [Bacteroidia bacterium]MCX7763411.1 nucleotidyltransferase domain-containing protein [Bacteroidia bacterium]MDW8057958.1 nucleotidyltransferase domain-containing protein [Bacteroidia bacterium]